MRYEIKNTPAYGLVEIELERGDEVTAESGSMVAMDPSVVIETSMGGFGRGFLGRLVALGLALIRKLFGGESFFVNRFRAESKPGFVWLAPALVGDVFHVDTAATPIFIEHKSYLASHGDVDLRVRFLGCRGIFSGEGAFFLHATGPGGVWINCFGAATQLDVDGKYIVDTGHVVAFDAGLDWRITTLGGLKSTVFGGEGLVIEFSGKGRVWIQSRNVGALVSWVTPLLPA
jgi:uncharacterized protein (TIGR00266 family)